MTLDCTEMRRDILRMALAAKREGGHLGGSLSAVEILAALYGGGMVFDPGNPSDEFRDRFIFSKGHGVMAQYAALRQLGILSQDDIKTYKQAGSALTAHPSVNPALGMDFASGSLGQGLSQGVGVAVALRRKGNAESRVFVLLGDGECDEGSVWEAAMAAASWQLSNLVAIVDRNGLQYDGDTEKVVALCDLAAKWTAFGWEAVEVDGHDVFQLQAAFAVRSGRPRAVIARTTKGKGISFMENASAWHHGVLTQRQFDQAMAELERLHG